METIKDGVMLRLALAVACLILLASCQEPIKEVVYRDITGQNRSRALLESDVVACDWDVTKVRMGLDYGPTLPPQPPFYEPCMAAKGWRVVYAR